MTEGWPLTGQITHLELVCLVEVYSPVQVYSPIQVYSPVQVYTLISQTKVKVVNTRDINDEQDDAKHNSSDCDERYVLEVSDIETSKKNVK